MNNAWSSNICVGKEHCEANRLVHGFCVRAERRLPLIIMQWHNGQRTLNFAGNWLKMIPNLDNLQTWQVKKKNLYGGKHDIMSVHRIKFSELANQFDLSVRSIESIFHEHLGMSKVSARWAPQNNRTQDRHRRVESSKELLELFNADPVEFLSCVNPGVETWVYHWDPEMKTEPIQWQAVDISTPEKAFHAVLNWQEYGQHLLRFKRSVADWLHSG